MTQDMAIQSTPIQRRAALNQPHRPRPLSWSIGHPQRTPTNMLGEKQPTTNAHKCSKMPCSATER